MLTRFLKDIFMEAWDKQYRVRSKARRIACPHPDYPKAAIWLPAEWTGFHVTRRQLAELAAEPYKTPELVELCIALSLVEKFENIPGVEGDDIKSWELNKVPVPILAWLIAAVNTDYLAAFKLPKEYLPRSGEALKGLAATDPNSAAKTPPFPRTN